MSSKVDKVNIYNFALLLFCLSSILELFIPRMDEANYFVRMPIQLINGSLLFLMWLTLLLRANNWVPLTKVVFLFIPLTIIHALVYISNYSLDVSAFAPYLRFLLWTTSIIFFYEMIMKFGINKNLMCAYVITFLIAITKKILESALFAGETFGGGDTAALPLLFIIPLILICFNSKIKIVLLSFVALLILISLRRTVILGFILCLPFIYKYISIKLKTYHLLILGIVFSSVIIYTWSIIGEVVFLRFQDLLVGDGGGDKGSYGSGRSEFYLTVWESWIHGDTFSLIFGNGLSSVSRLLMNLYNIEHAHNDFLEISYTFGLFGLGIWLAFIYRIWQLKNQLKQFYSSSVYLFYICFISYFIIALASGCALRITTMPFAFTIAILLYQVQKGKLALNDNQNLKDENIVLNKSLAYS